MVCASVFLWHMCVLMLSPGMWSADVLYSSTCVLICYPPAYVCANVSFSGTCMYRCLIFQHIIMFSDVSVLPYNVTIQQSRVC